MKTPCPRCRGRHTVWDRNSGAIWICPECSDEPDKHRFAEGVFVVFILLGAGIVTYTGFWLLSYILFRGHSIFP